MQTATVFGAHVQMAKDELLTALKTEQIHPDSFHRVASAAIDGLSEIAILGLLVGEALEWYLFNDQLPKGWSVGESQDPVSAVKALLRAIIVRILTEDAGVKQAFTRKMFKINESTGSLTFPPI